MAAMYTTPSPHVEARGVIRRLRAQHKTVLKIVNKSEKVINTSTRLAKDGVEPSEIDSVP